MSRMKPVVGQTLYALNVGNNARNCAQVLCPVKVTKVGRKYFSAAPEEYLDRPHMAVQYDLESWSEVTEYSARWRLYESERAWADEREANALYADLRNVFSGHGRPKVSLEALRIAHKALIPQKDNAHE